MAAIWRAFNGTTDNINTLSFSGNFSEISFTAWLKRDSAGLTRNGIVGRFASSTSGWMLGINEANELFFCARDGSGGGVVVDSPDLSDWGFIAVTYNKDGLAGEQVKFYYGTAPDNVTLIGQGAQTDQVPNGGGLGTSFGNVNQGNLVSYVGWNGRMDEFGLYQVELTLSEVIEAMACGNDVQDANALHCQIIGDDPEPITILGGVSDADAVGTTVEMGEGEGCETVPPAAVIPPGNEPFQRPPNFSGGVGGGFQVPTLSWDDGGPQAMAPTTENARVIQPPDFGKMGVNTRYGKGRAPMLSQRAASMFRSLDHLATYTRRRKK